MDENKINFILSSLRIAIIALGVILMGIIVSSSVADESYVEFDKDEMNKINVPLIHDSFESDQNRGKHDGEKLLKALLSLYETK